jgi:hypothetical protein
MLSAQFDEVAPPERMRAIGNATKAGNDCALET